MNNTTTTRNGFRVEDITFKNARRQSEILNEIETVEDVAEDDVKAPVSLTPEQVIEFYTEKIKVARDSNERRVYARTINWIKELLETKRKLIVLESKEEAKDDSKISDDIGEID